MSDFVLTHENYHGEKANRATIHPARLNRFWTAQLEQWQNNGEYAGPNQPPLLVGSYVDAYFDNGLDLFKAKHP